MNVSPRIPILPRRRKTVTVTRTTLPSGLPRSTPKLQIWHDRDSFWFSLDRNVNDVSRLRLTRIMIPSLGSRDDERVSVNIGP